MGMSPTHPTSPRHRAENELSESAVDFPTRTRIHVGIEVSDVERSLRFYQVLFGQAPTKVRPGYAKFEVVEPPVNFTLNEKHGARAAGGVTHFGIQFKSTQEVSAAGQRFAAVGIPTRTEEKTDCCHAVQDKIWVLDPEGNEWEFFVVLVADVPMHSAAQQPE